MKIKGSPVTFFDGAPHHRFDYQNEAGESVSVKVYKKTWSFENISFDGLIGTSQYELEINENNEVVSIMEIDALAEVNHDDEKSTDSSSFGEIKCMSEGKVFAYMCAEKAKSLGKEYKNHVKSLPMMIRTNGLGGTLAFLESKEEKTFSNLYCDITEYLKQKHISLNKTNNVLHQIAKSDSCEIMAFTKDVLIFLGWLRRFSEGLI